MRKVQTAARVETRAMAPATPINILSLVYSWLERRGLAQPRPHSSISQK